MTTVEIWTWHGKWYWSTPRKGTWGGYASEGRAKGAAKQSLGTNDLEFVPRIFR